MSSVSSDIDIKENNVLSFRERTAKLISEYQTKQQEVFDILKIENFLLGVGAFRRAKDNQQRVFMVSSLLNLYKFNSEATWTFGPKILNIFLGMFDQFQGGEKIVAQSLKDGDEEISDIVSEAQSFLVQRHPNIDKTVLSIFGTMVAVVCSLIGAALFKNEKSTFFHTFANFGRDISNITLFHKAGDALTTILEKFGFDMVDASNKAAEEGLLELQGIVIELEEFQRLCSDGPSYIVENMEHFSTLEKECFRIEKKYSTLISSVSFRTLVPVYTNFHKLHVNLSKVLAEFRSETERQVPVCLYLYGAPGAGKSYLLQEIAKRVHSKLGIPYTSYIRNPTDQFWSGYRGQSTVIYDDMFSLAEGKDAQEFLSISTPAPYSLNMPAIEEKGARFTSLFLFCASNAPFYRSLNVMVNPQATDRRRDLMFEVVQTKEPSSTYDSTFSHVVCYQLKPNPGSPKIEYVPNARKRNNGRDAKNSSIHEIDEIVDLVCQKYKEKQHMYHSTKTESEVICKQSIAEINRSEGIIPLLLGPPGIGKTRLLDEINNMFPDKFIIEDEFSMTKDVEAMLKKVIDSYKGSSRPLILAANNTTYYDFLKKLDEDRKGLFTRRIKIFNFNFKKKSVFSKYTREDVKQHKKCYDDLVEITSGGMNYTRDNLKSFIELYNNAAVLEVVHLDIFNMEVQSDLGYPVINLPTNLSEFSSLKLENVGLMISNRVLVKQIYDFFSKTQIEDIRKAILEINNKNFKYEGDPIYIRSGDLTFLGFAYEKTLKLVLTGSSNYSEVDGVLYVGEAAKRRANATEEKFLRRLKEVVEPVEKCDTTKIWDKIKSRKDSLKAQIIEFFRHPFIATCFDVIKILVPIAMTAIGMKYAFCSSETIKQESLDWAEESADMVGHNSPPYTKKARITRSKPNTTLSGSEVTYSGDIDNVNLESKTSIYTNETKVKEPVKIESTFEHNNQNAVRPKTKVVNLSRTATFAKDPPNMCTPSWDDPDFSYGIGFESMGDVILNTRDNVFYKNIKFKCGGTQYHNLMQAIIHKGFQFYDQNIDENHLMSKFDQLTDTVETPLDLPLNIFKEWQKKARLLPKKYRVRGKSKKFCTSKSSGEDQIGVMLTSASGYVRSEAISDQLMHNCLKLCTHARAVAISGCQSTYALMVRASYGVCPAHLVNFDAKAPLSIKKDDKTYDAKIIQIHDQKDFLMFKITDKTFPPAKDIVCHFVDKSMADPTSKLAILPIPYRENEQVLESGEANTLVAPIKFEKKHCGKYYTTRSCEVGTYNVMFGAQIQQLFSQDGDCGLPFILTKTPEQRRIFGIHVAAGPHTGYACIITESELENMMVCSQNLVLKAEPFCSSRFTEQDHVLLNAEVKEWKHNIKILGSGRSFKSDEPFHYHVSGKTQLYPSPLKIEHELFQEFEPACTGFNDARMPRGDKLSQAFEKYSTVEPAFNFDEYMVSIRAITEDYASIIREKGKSLKVYTTREAINRDTSMENSNPLELRSSSGFPYNKIPGVKFKSPMITLQDFHKVPIYDINLDCDEGKFLRSRINHFIDESKQMRRPIMITTACLKDEARPIGKIDKARIFYACPLDAVIVGRRFNGALQSVLAELRSYHPIKIGIVPQSIEWTFLQHELTRNGELGFDADYKGYDITVKEQFFEGIKYFYNTLYQKFDPNWSSKDDNVRNGFYTALQKPLCLIKNHLCQLPSGHVSGQPGTAIDNSIMNLAINYTVARLSYMEKTGRYLDYRTFKDQISLAIYGDDIITIVNPDSRFWFNFNIFKRLVKENFGMNVTIGNKSDNEPDFLHIDQMTFLKRKFVHLGCGVFTGGLTNDAFSKMLAYTRDPSWHKFERGEPVNCNNLEVLQSTARTALDEAAFRGRGFFLKLRNHFLEVSKKYHISLPVDASFDTIIHTYLYNMSERPKISDAVLIKERIIAQSLNLNEMNTQTSSNNNASARTTPVTTGATVNSEATPGVVDATPQESVAKPPLDSAGAISHIQSANNIISFMYDTYMLSAEFSWSSSTSPGTVLFSKPVNPLQSNEIISHIARCHNAWAGSMDYQVIVSGTGFQAGKLMAVWVPPNLNVNSLSLKQLTGFPMRIIDVKTGNELSMTSRDQNPRAFHYMNQSSDIGGTFAILVYSQLRNSSEGASSVNIQVSEKLSQDFLMLGPQPPSVDDNFFNFDARRIALDVNTHPVFNIFTKDLVELRINPNSTWQYGTSFLIGIFDEITKIPNFSNFANRFTDLVGTAGVLDIWKSFEEHEAEYHNINIGCTNVEAIAGTTRWGVKNINLQKALIKLTTDNALPNNTVACIRPSTDAGGRFNVQHLALTDAVSAGDLVAPVITESIVSFNYAADPSNVGVLQTRDIAQSFVSGLFDEIPEGMCAQYILRDTDAGLNLRYVKLHRAGFFSTVKTANILKYDLANMELIFTNFIPSTTPLPTTVAT